MHRRHQAVYFVGIIALLVSMFSPILNQPVVAQDPETEPVLATPVTEPTPITPELPVVSDTVCGDGVTFAQEATAIQTEGITYSIGAPDSNGVITISATLTNTELTTWADGGLEGWVVDGDVATTSITLAPCPDAQQESSGEIVANELPATPDDVDIDAAATTGCGPARDTGLMRSMNARATSTQLEVSISADPTSGITASSTITYTIQVVNNTGIDQHYTLTDTLTPGVTYLSHTVPYPLKGDYCEATGGTIDCGLAENMMLYPGWVDEWTITVAVNDDAADPSTTCQTGLVNTVTLTGGWDGSASATSVFADTECVPQLSLSMVADTPVIDRLDQQLSFTATITNSSTVAASDVRFYMLLDNTEDEFQNLPWELSHTSSSGSCDILAGDVECAPITVPGRVGDTPGSVTITLSVPVGTPLPDYMCSFNQSLSAKMDHASLPEIVRQSASVEAECEPAFDVDITADKTIVSPNERINYTVTVTNIGLGTYATINFEQDQSHIMVQIYQELGIFGGFILEDDSPEFSCISVGILCFFTEGAELASGSSASATFSLKAPGRISDTACARGEGLDVVFTSPLVVNVRPEPQVILDCTQHEGLEISKSGPTGSQVMGVPFAYTIDVMNTSDDPYIDSYSFVDTLPAGLTVAQDGLPEGCTEAVDNEITSVTCSADEADIAAGDSDAYTITVVAPWDSGSLICGNQADNSTVTVTNSVTGDLGTWNPARKSDSANVDISCQSDLILKVTSEQTVVNPGESVVFRFTVLSPTGDYPVPIPFEGILGTESTPAGFFYGSGSGLNCSTSGLPTKVHGCAQYDMGVPAFSIYQEFVAQIQQEPTSNTCESGISATATLGDGPWAPEAAHTLTANVKVNCQDLHIATDVSSNTVAAGEEFVYTTTVTNSGSNSLGDGYAFTDTLPPGIELAGADTFTSPDGTTCTPTISNGITTIDCHSDSSPAGEGGAHEYRFAVTANFNLHPAVCEGVTNTVTGTSGAWNESAKSASSDTSIDCTDYRFTIEPVAPSVVPGETIAWMVTVENTGELDMTGLLIYDSPAELPGDGEWTYTFFLNDVPFDSSDFHGVPAGDTLTMLIESSVIPPDLPLPDTEWCIPWNNPVSAEIYFSNGELAEEESTATVQVNCTGLSIDQDVSSDTIQPGGQVEYTITVTNDGNTTVSPLTVFHDATETGSVFSNWHVTSEGEMDCGLVEDADPGCTNLTLIPDETIEITITGDAPVLPTVEQCGPVSSQAGLVSTEPNISISSDPVTTQIDCQPGIAIEMNGELDPGANNRVDSGDTVTYTLTITNSGNIALYDNNVNSNLSGMEWDKDLSIAELLPQQTETFTATYTITQADIDVGYLEVTASVLALIEPSGDASSMQVLGFARAQVAPVLELSVANQVTERIELTQESGIELDVSSAAGSDVPGLGDVITYTFIVTNTGNVTLTNIDVISEMDGLDFADGTTIATLAPGESGTLRATYTVTQADADAGSVVLCTNATATDSNDDAVTDADVCVTHEIAQPLPATPTTPATPVAETDTPQSVTSLPETGSGDVVSITSVLWAAAVLGVVAIGIGGIGIRRSRS